MTRHTRPPLKKRMLIIVTGVALLAFAAAGLLHFGSSPSDAPAADALGLRGATAVVRPLSKTQVERLETHFLDVPAHRGSGVAAPPHVKRSLDQIDAINRLNARQAR